MEEEIRHNGIVLSVAGGIARVQIVQTSACAACKAKHMCTSAESQEKIIEAEVMDERMNGLTDERAIKPGDAVEVVVREKLAWKAVVLGYILPFVVMMLVIVVLDIATEWDEAVVGTTALCAIAVYYLVLRLFRNKLQKEFSITCVKC